MIGRPGVAAQMFATLAVAGVNIQMISTSEVKVSCVVAATECDRAVAALRTAFEIAGEDEGNREAGAQGRRGAEERTHRNISRLPLCPSAPLPDSPPVRGVALDMNQVRVAIRQLPDRPGMAAKLFGLLAQHNISVDMIIQSQRCRLVDGIARRDIAFTVARIDGENAQKLLSQAATELDWGEVVLDSAIAKVSIVGSGMVGQPGVAAKMFAALALNQINIQMIATSEIKISCVVAQQQGSQALQVIHEAFGLAGSEKFVIPA